MRTILVSGARPRIGQSQPVSSSGPIISTRRSAISQLGRKLTLCDAFAVLLAPVLTAAFVADITQKDRRRRQWVQKIAQVQHESNELREREAGAWSRLQVNSIHAGIVPQRRCYSTAISTAESRISAVNANQEVGVENTAEGNHAESQDIPHRLLVNLQRYENCLAQKVGLQLLLHLSTGVQITAKLNIDMPDKEIVVPDSVESLLKRLSAVHQQLFQLRPTLSDLPRKLNLRSEERQELDERISKLTWRCRTGQISVTELAFRYTQAVMKSQVGLSLDAYQNLVETLSTLDQDILTNIAMSPYLNTHQVLSDRHVGNIIQQYGKVKDPARLERFLRRLTKPEGFEIASTWGFVTVNGVRVPSPLNGSTALLDILTRSALQGDQPHKAQAWALLLIQQQNASAHRLAAVFNNFLTYCARHTNWADGNLWLHRTTTWVALLAKDAPWTLQKLIYRMLDLCVSCNQTQQYNRILDAAVCAGIDLAPLDETRPDAISDQARKIRDDWASRIALTQPLLRDRSEFLQAATKFQIEMAKISSAIQSFVGVTNKQTLQALASSERTSNSRRSLQSSGLATNNVQPWGETYHLNTPEGILMSKPIVSTSFDGQTWDDTDLQAVPVPMSIQEESENIVNETMSSGTEQQLSKMQEAYDELTTRFEQQRETIDELQKSSSTNVSDSLENEQIQQELQDLMKQLFTTQNQNAKLQSRNSFLQDKHDHIQAKNDKLEVLLSESKEKERELVELSDRLQVQLKTPTPKSLEAVFLERENLNVRFELRTLSDRYLLALDEKENMLRENQALREQLENKGEEKTTEVNSLQRENEYLREQLAIAEKRYDSSAHKFTIRRLNMKPVNSSSPGESIASSVAPDGQEEQYEYDRKRDSPIKRFALRTRRSNNDTSLDSSRSAFSLSSS